MNCPRLKAMTRNDILCTQIVEYIHVSKDSVLSSIRPKNVWQHLDHNCILLESLEIFAMQYNLTLNIYYFHKGVNKNSTTGATELRENILNYFLEYTTHFINNLSTQDYLINTNTKCVFIMTRYFIEINLNFILTFQWHYILLSGNKQDDSFKSPCWRLKLQILIVNGVM